VLRVGDEYYELLQCGCGELKLEKVDYTPTWFIEAYPHRVFEVTAYGEGDALAMRRKELKVYRCVKDGFTGDSLQMGIHLGNVHGRSLKFAIDEGLVKETGEVVVKYVRG